MAVPRFHLLTPVIGLDVLARLVSAGADAVQVRDKAATDRELVAFARACVDRLGPGGTRVIVNDRFDLALAAGAHGVHLGADDVPIDLVRRHAPDLLIGGTCRTPEDALAARDAGADYVGFGPVFATTSKTGLPDPLGPEAITAAAAVLPVIAVGGIDASRVRSVLDAGAHGVAVIGAVLDAPDPYGAALDIAAEIDRALVAR